LRRCLIAYRDGVMVKLHVKRSDDNQFLFETTVEINVRDLIRQLVELHNNRLRIQRLKMEGDELAKHGPSKHPEKQGLDDDDAADRPERYSADPTGRRTGEAAVQQAVDVLLKTLDAANKSVNKKQVENRVNLTNAALLDHIDLIRGAVMIAYPMGLPEWDPVRMALEDDEDLAGTQFGQEILEPDSTQMWFANKMMLPENKLKDHVGRNEKTKVVIKLTKKGAGAPAREPQVSAEEQKAMLAYYYKKQEEQKKLAENTDDDYTNSAWASSGSLKSAIGGPAGGVHLPQGSAGFNGGQL